VRASVAGRGSFLPRLGFWAQAYGSRDRSGEGNRTVELFGVEVPVSSRLETDRLGGQVGFDASIGAVLVGATAGYAKADADAGAASDIDSDAFNLGAYAAVGAAAGPYAVLTVKHDWIDVDLENPGLPVPGLDATSLGGDVEVGWRGTLLAASVDFNAGLSVVRSDLDGFEIDATSFETGSSTSMRGRAGGRVTLNGPLRPFAEARVFHEFGDDGALRIVSGNLDDELEGERGTWARLEAGIGGGNDRALLSLWGDFGDREGFGVRAGLKF
jgi:outer membrane autotransporter protein